MLAFLFIQVRIGAIDVGFGCHAARCSVSRRSSLRSRRARIQFHVALRIYIRYFHASGALHE